MRSGDSSQQATASVDDIGCYLAIALTLGHASDLTTIDDVTVTERDVISGQVLRDGHILDPYNAIRNELRDGRMHCVAYRMQSAMLVVFVGPDNPTRESSPTQ